MIHGNIESTCLDISKWNNDFNNVVFCEKLYARLLICLLIISLTI